MSKVELLDRPGVRGFGAVSIVVFSLAYSAVKGLVGGLALAASFIIVALGLDDDGPSNEAMDGDY